MNSDNFIFAYAANNSVFLPNFTNNGFMIENSNKLEFYSGSMTLDADVNNIIQNYDVELLACNGITLKDGFKTGDKSFKAHGGIGSSTEGYPIEGCTSMLNNYSFQLIDNVSNSTESKLSILPNPISQYFQIIVLHPNDDVMIVEILDSQGRILDKIIENERRSGSYEFQITNFNYHPGLYFCRYSNSKETISCKFIKK